MAVHSHSLTDSKNASITHQEELLCFSLCFCESIHTQKRKQRLWELKKKVISFVFAEATRSFFCCTPMASVSSSASTTACAIAAAGNALPPPPPFYFDEKWKLSKKEASSRSRSSTCPLMKNSSSSHRRCSFTRKCARLVKEQRARFYIMRRCVTMLICWRDYSDSWKFKKILKEKKLEEV